MNQPDVPEQVRLQPIHPKMGREIPLPRQMSELAAGYDLSAALDAPMQLGAGAWQLVPCGFRMQLPAGYEAQIRPRSGLARKHGISCLNTPGTIDADFRGEVMVLLVNFGKAPFTIEPGMRIAQMVFARLPSLQLQLVASLDATDRAEGGFGSTG